MTLLTAFAKLVEKRRNPLEPIKLTPKEKTSIATTLGSIATMALVSALTIAISYL